MVKRFLNWSWERIASFLLLIIYLTARIIRTPLWWVEIVNFETWNYPGVDDCEEWEVEEAQTYAKQRIKDLMIMIVIAVVYLMWLFIPWYWYLISLGAMILIFTTVVITALMRVRAKRIKIEKELMEINKL